MRRREIITALGGLAVAGSFAANAQNAAEMHPPKYKSLEESAGKCVATGEDCLRHCLAMMSMKDTSMADCANMVVQLIASCRALQTLASLNSTFTPGFAKEAGLVCAACEKECRKFYDKYPVCKTCADACKTCTDDCHKVAA
ncbi:MAG: four-helix bundle copper-binding protein [Bryobacteraceae bacterium]